MASTWLSIGPVSCNHGEGAYQRRAKLLPDLTSWLRQTNALRLIQAPVRVSENHAGFVFRALGWARSYILRNPAVLT